MNAEDAALTADGAEDNATREPAASYWTAEEEAVRSPNKHCKYFAYFFFFFSWKLRF